MAGNTIYRGGQQLKVSELRAVQMIRNNEIARSVASKLIRDPNKTGVSGYNGKRIIDDNILNSLSKKTATNIEDSSYIFQTLPDTKIAMEIWVSCLLSPKDGITESLIWSIDHSSTEYSAELFGDMLNVLKNYFEKEYGIFDILRPAIEDALFKTGSYPLVIVPESNLDDIINGKSSVSAESIIHQIFSKDAEGYKVPGIGILGGLMKKTKIQHGLESLIANPTVNQSMLHKQIHPNLFVTDNPIILKAPLALRQARKQNARQTVLDRFSLEAFAKVNLQLDETKTQQGEFVIRDDGKDKEQEKKNIFDSKVKDSLSQKLYRDRAYSNQPVAVIRDSASSGRMSVGHPLVLKVPSAAIIPVHTPGNPRDIIGGFVIVDEYGNPLDPSNASDLFDISRNSADEKINGSKRILKQMSFYNSGCCDCINDSNPTETLNELARAYGSLIEEDLLNRLTNGIYGENIEIGKVEEIYRIMLSRALSAMRTQILYVPGELLTYFAFDYNRYGIGKSMLEDARTLANVRAAVEYADIYASIMNSIGRKKLNITLDPDDPDPLKSIEYYRNEYLRVSAWNLPLLSQGPIDAINVLREGAVDVVVMGDHQGVPQSGVDVEDHQLQRPVPDDSLKEKLQERYVSCFDLPSSIVNDTQSVEFAQQVIQSNMLLNKRVNEKQRIINNDLLYDHITKYTLNSGSLIRSLSLVIKDHKDLLTDKQRAHGTTLPIIQDFLDNLTVSLPSPDRQRTEDQKDDIGRQQDLVNTAIDALLPDSVLELALPEPIKDQANSIKDLIKSTIMNRYIAENNYVPYFYNLIDEENVDDTVLAEIVSYLKPIAKLATDSIFAFDRIRKENDSNALKSAVPGDDDDYGGSSDYGSSDSSDDDDSDSSGGGDDDFGFGDMDDMGGDDDSGDNDDDEDGGDEGNEDKDDLVF